jgi:hypothetical protein
LTDYLTKRNGYWAFVRRVPIEFAHLDTRGVVKHSTKIAVAKDRRGLKAGRIADVMNRELEAYWRGLSDGKGEEAAAKYVEARRRARTLGFEYYDTAELVERPTVEILQRLEALMKDRGIEDVGAQTALLGFAQRPSVLLSKVWETFEHITRTEVKDMSPDQHRRWRNGYKHAIEEFISVVGDKTINQVTHDDVLDYTEWLQDRVDEGEIIAKTANNYIGHNSKMFKTISRKQRLGVPDLFAGMRLAPGHYVQRPAFPVDFVQNSLLADGALMGLDPEAQRVLFLLADTGLRVGEAVNLQSNAIHLDAEIPYIEVLADGRRVKTRDSLREIPLVGVALEAMKLQPKGFPKFFDKGGSLCARVNHYLTEKKLRPTPKHTTYSLRHTFKDRLVATKAQDSMIESLLGHADDHPKYGSAPPLKMKLAVLKKIAFKPPKTL